MQQPTGWFPGSIPLAVVRACRRTLLVVSLTAVKFHGIAGAAWRAGPSAIVPFCHWWLVAGGSVAIGQGAG